MAASRPPAHPRTILSNDRSIRFEIDSQVKRGDTLREKSPQAACFAYSQAYHKYPLLSKATLVDQYDQGRILYKWAKALAMQKHHTEALATLKSACEKFQNPPPVTHVDKKDFALVRSFRIDMCGSLKLYSELLGHCLTESLSKDQFTDQENIALWTKNAWDNLTESEFTPEFCNFINDYKLPAPVWFKERMQMHSHNYSAIEFSLHQQIKTVSVLLHHQVLENKATKANPDGEEKIIKYLSELEEEGLTETTLAYMLFYLDIYSVEKPKEVLNYDVIINRLRCSFLIAKQMVEMLMMGTPCDFENRNDLQSFLSGVPKKDLYIDDHSYRAIINRNLFTETSAGEKKLQTMSIPSDIKSPQDRLKFARR